MFRCSWRREVATAPCGYGNSLPNGEGEVMEEDVSNANGAAKDSKQIGTLFGTVETGNRITCLGAFLLDGKSDLNNTVEEDEVATTGEREESNSESDDEDNE